MKARQGASGRVSGGNFKGRRLVFQGKCSMAQVTNMNRHSVTLGGSVWTGRFLSSNGMDRGSSQKGIAGGVGSAKK